jgi:hypothetical protein
VVEEGQSEVHGLVADYDTPRAELEAAMAAFIDKRREKVDRLAEAHFALKRKATVKEWKRLLKSERAALDWVASQVLGNTPIVEG